MSLNVTPTEAGSGEPSAKVGGRLKRAQIALLSLGAIGIAYGLVRLYRTTSLYASDWFQIILTAALAIVTSWHWFKDWNKWQGLIRSALLVLVLWGLTWAKVDEKSRPGKAPAFAFFLNDAPSPIRDGNIVMVPWTNDVQQISVRVQNIGGLSADGLVTRVSFPRMVPITAGFGWSSNNPVMGFSPSSVILDTNTVMLITDTASIQPQFDIFQCPLLTIDCRKIQDIPFQVILLTTFKNAERYQVSVRLQFTKGIAKTAVEDFKQRMLTDRAARTIKTKYSTMTDKKLVDHALAFISSLRDFAAEAEARQRKPLYQRMYLAPNTNRDEWMKSFANEQKEQDDQQRSNRVQYNKSFRIEAMILFDELVSRFPKGQIPIEGGVFGRRIGNNPHRFEWAADVGHFDEIADTLELLARQLPQQD